jgi:hypothetical protein
MIVPFYFCVSPSPTNMNQPEEEPLQLTPTIRTNKGPPCNAGGLCARNCASFRSERVPGEAPVHRRGAGPGFDRRRCRAPGIGFSLAGPTQGHRICTALAHRGNRWVLQCDRRHGEIAEASYPAKDRTITLRTNVAAFLLSNVAVACPALRSCLTLAALANNRSRRCSCQTTRPSCAAPSPLRVRRTAGLRLTLEPRKIRTQPRRCATRFEALASQEPLVLYSRNDVFAFRALIHDSTHPEIVA